MSKWQELNESCDDCVPLLVDTTDQHTKPFKMNSSFHCHRAEARRDVSRQAMKQLLFACALCLLFVIGELVGGYYSGSLAIMSDAAHMFSDFGSFTISLVAIWLGEKRAKKNMSFGFYRAEVIGALATVVIIWYVTGILAYLAVLRLKTGDFEIEDDAMIAVAAAAVVFNIILGLCLHGVCFNSLPGLAGHNHSHGNHTRLNEDTDVEVQTHAHAHQPHKEKHINIRAAMIHVLGDFLQSIGVLFSSVLIKIFGDSLKIADPICTLIFAVIVLFTTVGVFKDAVHILMEGAPKSINYDLILKDLQKLEDVQRVHDLHIWSLTADIPVASCHLVISTTADHHQILMEANSILQEKYHVGKATIQVEREEAENGDCVRCQPLN